MSDVLTVCNFTRSLHQRIRCYVCVPSNVVPVGVQVYVIARVVRLDVYKIWDAWCWIFVSLALDIFVVARSSRELLSVIEFCCKPYYQRRHENALFQQWVPKVLSFF